MKIKKYIAKTFQEGKLLIMEELGEEAVILSSRTMPIDAEGESNIEIIAGINEVESSPNATINKESSPVYDKKRLNSIGDAKQGSRNRLLSNYKNTGQLSSGDKSVSSEADVELQNVKDKNKVDFFSKIESLTKPLSNIINKLEESNKDNSSVHRDIDAESREYLINSQIEDSYKNNKISSIDLSFITSTNSDLSEIKKSIKNIESIEKYKNSNLLSSTHQKLYTYLIDQDFSEYFSLELIGIATQNLYRNIQNHLKQMIFDSVANYKQQGINSNGGINNLNIFSQVNDFNLLRQEIINVLSDKIEFSNQIVASPKQQRVMFLGPSGSGKTSSLIKLAIIMKLLHNSKILIISLDTYKVGGIEQLQTLSSIATIPFKAAFSSQELQKILFDAKDYDFVFIDTAGKSPKEEGYLKDLKELVNIAVPTKTYLVQNATTNNKTFRKVLQDFSAFKISAVILSKIDEAESIGSAISLIAEQGLPISYFTNGQQIPDEIEPASIDKLINFIFKE